MMVATPATPPPAISPVEPRSAVPARMRALGAGTAAHALLWAAAASSHWAGWSTLHGAVAWLLPVSFWICTALLLSIAASDHAPDWSRPRFIALQSALAIATICVYAVSLSGAGELVPWMYLTVVLLAAPRVQARTLEGLAVSALLAYAGSLGVRAVLLPLGELPTSQLTAFACASLALALTALHAHHVARRQLHSRQILERRDAELRILRLQGTPDALARSYRRQHMAAILDKEKARAERSGRSFSICMMDLEPATAAVLGPDTGKVELLRSRLGDRARTLLRATDTLTRTRYRRPFGNEFQEEFLAVLPDTRLGQAQLCAERVTRSVRARLGDQEAPARLAAGIAEYRPGESIADLLRRAEQALHVAQRDPTGAVGAELPAHPGRPSPPPGRPRLRLVRRNGAEPG